MFGFFFTTERNVDRYAKVMACDVERFKRFFHGMLNEGIYFAPSAFEAGFLSAAHIGGRHRRHHRGGRPASSPDCNSGAAYEMRAFAWFLGAILLAGLIGALRRLSRL